MNVILGKQYVYDFYGICARHEGMPRHDLKNKLIWKLYHMPELVRKNGLTFEPSSYLVHLQPEVLDNIHPDARAEILFYNGIVVGDN